MEALQLALRTEDADGPLSGWLLVVGGQPRTFVGWIGLLQAVQEVVRSRMDDGDEGER